jgi:CheY-like chemotaxis protein
LTAPADLRSRILIVEDEMMIALLIEDVLEELGYEMVGPVSKLEAAVKLARDETFDAAILDVNIRGGDTYPVATILRERGIPFVMASGYGGWALPDAFKGQPLLQKPFTAADVKKVIGAMLSEA